MSHTTGKQFSEEREKIIMDLLEKHGRITVAETAQILGISASTMRIQFQKMHDKGLLQRTHGGAIRIGHAQPEPEHPHDSTIVHYEQKYAIAATAAKTIKDGDYVALGSGTTVYLLATMLHEKKDLTVVTDSIPIAYELLDDPEITLYVCGGWVMPRNRACRGTTAESFFTDLHVDKAYCGADSVNIRSGVTSVDFDPRTERAVCRSGNSCYILADSSKFYVKPSIDRVIDLSEITCLISDAALKPQYIDELKQQGVEVVITEDA